MAALAEWDARVVGVVQLRDAAREGALEKAAVDGVGPRARCKGRLRIRTGHEGAAALGLGFAFG